MYKIMIFCSLFEPHFSIFSDKETTPVDDGNFEKVLDILVEHPQLVKNWNELADELLHTFYSRLKI
mgnify:CR=1 FL=1